MRNVAVASRVFRRTASATTATAPTTATRRPTTTLASVKRRVMRGGGTFGALIAGS